MADAELFDLRQSPHDEESDEDQGEGCPGLRFVGPEPDMVFHGTVVEEEIGGGADLEAFRLPGEGGRVGGREGGREENE